MINRLPEYLMYKKNNFKIQVNVENQGKMLNSNILTIDITKDNFSCENNKIPRCWYTSVIPCTTKKPSGLNNKQKKIRGQKEYVTDKESVQNVTDQNSVFKAWHVSNYI